MTDVMSSRSSFAVSLTPGESWEGALLHDLIDGTIVCAAPPGRVLLEPALSVWPMDVTLYGLRCGDQAFDLAFCRGNDGLTDVTVLRGDPACIVRGHAEVRSSTWPAPSLLAVNELAE